MAKIRRRQRCPKCGSLNIIRWGTREGHQRYKCRDCGATFVKHKEGVRQSNRSVWFRKWVLGKQTIEDIAQECGYSTRQLHRWFDEYLDSSPSWTMNTSQPIYLLIDGTYYSDDHCLILYRAENLKRTIFYRFTDREDDDQIASDLLNIRDLGYDVIGITTDGGDNIIRAVYSTYSPISPGSDASSMCNVIAWLQSPRGRVLRRQSCSGTWCSSSASSARSMTNWRG